MGARLRLKRIEQGYNQRRAAEACKVRQSSFAKWENGKGYPEVGNAPAVMRFLDISPETFDELVSRPLPTQEDRLTNVELTLATIERRLDDLFGLVRNLTERDGQRLDGGG